MPTSTPMSPITRLIFWFVAVNALAGALSLMLLPGQTDRLFFWTIRPPINAALFGALYFGGAAATGVAAWRGRWEPARYLIPVLVSAGILISLTTLAHLDRFAPGFRLAYWLVVYIGAPVLAVLIYIGQERSGANWSAHEPARPATRVLAVAVGATLLVAGAAVVVAPGLVVAHWPWPTTPLIVRIFTSWFSAFGVGLVWFAVERDWGRLRPIANLMIAAAALDLLMTVIHRGDVPGLGTFFWVYCAHLILLGALGGAMHWLQLGGQRVGAE